MKKYLHFFTILLLIFCLLTGCGTADPPPETTSDGPITQSTTSQPDATAGTAPPEASTEISAEEKTEATTAPVPEPAPADDSFSIHFIDVGQADAALVCCDGEFMLIDGGNRGDSSRIYTVLKNAGAQDLKLIVATHPHEDHIGGLPGALNFATAETVLSPVTEYDSEIFADLKTYAAEKSTGLTVPEAGDTYTLGRATVTILGLNLGADTNDTSIVLRIDYGSTSFLFTGDAELPAEKALLDRSANLSADLLKVGHHGSETSTGYVFLREVMPAYAVISVGEGNSYSHPEEPVLSRLMDAGVQLFRTDLMGDIHVYSDGNSLTFSPARQATEAALFTPADAEEKPAETAPQTTPPTGEDAYVLNTNSKKFHLPSCRSVKDILAQNYAESSDARSDLLAQGYAPCGNCKP